MESLQYTLEFNKLIKNTFMMQLPGECFLGGILLEGTVHYLNEVLELSVISLPEV